MSPATDSSGAQSIATLCRICGPVLCELQQRGVDVLGRLQRASLNSSSGTSRKVQQRINKWLKTGLTELVDEILTRLGPGTAVVDVEDVTGPALDAEDIPF